ncbi:hypothetical protein SSPIM334S_01090 [Streptomyces spiroverticillatus]|uniref:hypothetical protein n=1 Tax=Streptomyces finlayi TaxID=67296 RepID=UPI001677B6BF|nr:hypothetical protein [Streptomyces finlayi]
MRARGLNYDTGFLPDDELSRPVFTEAAVRRDTTVLADEPHCEAVRISGPDPERPEHGRGSGPRRRVRAERVRRGAGRYEICGSAARVRPFRGAGNCAPSHPPSRAAKRFR